MLDAETWPLALLALRIAAVVLLYLFLATAFRTLRADLRAATTAPERARTPEPTSAERWATAPPIADAPPASPALPAQPPAFEDWDDQDREGWDEWEASLSDAPPVRAEPPRGLRRPRVWLPIAAAVLVAGFGGMALLLTDSDPGAPPSSNVGGEATAVSPLEPPAVAPGSGRVTVGLATLEDAQLRVTVDGVVEFEGTLRRGQRQAWEAGERIQVWTDNGRQVQLAVNGVDLGAYSPAMGHPDWNRIDFGFWPGWAP